jgi:hypothetical protein
VSRFLFSVTCARLLQTELLGRYMAGLPRPLGGLRRYNLSQVMVNLKRKTAWSRRVPPALLLKRLGRAGIIVVCKGS